MVKCKKQIIGESTCYIYFGKISRNYKCSSDIGFTHRGEQVIVDYNPNGQIIGIELLGSKQAPKPCQQVGLTLEQKNKKSNQKVNVSKS